MLQLLQRPTDDVGIEGRRVFRVGGPQFGPHPATRPFRVIDEITAGEHEQLRTLQIFDHRPSRPAGCARDVGQDLPAPLPGRSYGGLHVVNGDSDQPGRLVELWRDVANLGDAANQCALAAQSILAGGVIL